MRWTRARWAVVIVGLIAAVALLLLFWDFVVLTLIHGGGVEAP